MINARLMSIHYIAESMSERDADDFIISGKGDISRMWICDKYGKVAQMLK